METLTQLNLFMTKEEREDYLRDKTEEEKTRNREAQLVKDMEAYKRNKPLENAAHRLKLEAEWAAWAKGGIFDPHEHSCWLIGGKDNCDGTQWP